MPGRNLSGVTCRTKTSTPRFIQGPSGKLSWIAATMLDFPDRGAPLRTTIRPARVTTAAGGSARRSRRRRAEVHQYAGRADERTGPVVPRPEVQVVDDAVPFDPLAQPFPRERAAQPREELAVVRVPDRGL